MNADNSKSKSRASLNIRLQPYANSPLGEVIEYLNNLKATERNRCIGEILTIFLLPYARGNNGGISSEKLRATIYNCNDATDKHFHRIYQTFEIENSSSQLQTIIAGLAAIGNLNKKSSLHTNTLEQEKQFEEANDELESDSITSLLSSENNVSVLRNFAN